MTSYEKKNNNNNDFDATLKCSRREDRYTV